MALQNCVWYVHALYTHSLTSSDRASCVSMALMFPAHILWINWCMCVILPWEENWPEKRDSSECLFESDLKSKTLPEPQTNLVHLIHTYTLHRSRYVCLSYPNCNFCCRYFPPPPQQTHIDTPYGWGDVSRPILSVTVLVCALITWESLTLCKPVCSWLPRLSLEILLHTEWRCSGWWCSCASWELKPRWTFEMLLPWVRQPTNIYLYIYRIRWWTPLLWTLHHSHHSSNFAKGFLKKKFFLLREKSIFVGCFIES